MPRASHKKSNLKQTITGIAGVVLLGAIGSGAWDLIAKPSLTGIGRTFLDTFTFGSTTIKDRAYATAALDPTSLPSLALATLISCAPIILLMVVIQLEFFESKIRRFMLGAVSDKLKTLHATPEAPNVDSQREVLLTALRKRKRLVAVFLICWLIAGIILSQIIMSICNQSVLIWRVFHADLAICSSVVSETDRKNLEARFAAMNTRAEYLLIAEAMDAIAKEHHLILRKEELW